MKTTDLRSLIKLLSFNKISRKEFLDCYFEGKTYNEEYFLNLLRKGSADRNLETFEEALYLIFVAEFYSNTLSTILCAILLEDWHHSHEDIARLLKKISDPLTVDCIYKAAEKNYEYLNYDDTYQFSRKCIKALASIGNENAIHRIKQLSKSETYEISLYAQKELINMGWSQ